MGTKKCYHCGLIDSIHVNDERSSKLVAAYGPKDDDGLQMYFIYCHACNFVNIYKPGWFGNLKFNSYLDTREVWNAYQKGQMSRAEMGIFAGKIQEAMMADGMLPKDWSVV
jgi:hypothetical protein